jgi:hypothetical protein
VRVAALGVDQGKLSPHVHDKHTDAPSILAVDARARKIEYEPALLDTQADDVHATLGGLPASTIDVTPPQRKTPIPNWTKKAPSGRAANQKTRFSCQLSRYRRRAGVSVARRAVPDPASRGPFAAPTPSAGMRGFPAVVGHMSFAPSISPRG